MPLDQRIIDAVKAIGRSKAKLSIFQAVYYHKQRLKSVDEIAEAAGLTREQVLQSGVSLKKHGLFEQDKKDGVVAYRQIEFFQNHKAAIIRFVETPSKLEKVLNAQPIQTASPSIATFVRSRPKNVTMKGGAKSKSARLRVAFLTADPSADAPLRTQIEMRDVQREIRKSSNRDLVEIRYVPAARPEELLDVLNEFKPQIVHFSGHGGGGGITFDNKEVDDDGGVDVDFEAVHDLISSTEAPPVLLVFNACATIQGADVFLETVSAVVAMSDSITDSAATLFSVRFYAALVSGQPLEFALKQGKAMMSALGLDDAELPTVLAKKGINPAKLKFV